MISANEKGSFIVGLVIGFIVGMSVGVGMVLLS